MPPKAPKAPPRSNSVLYRPPRNHSLDALTISKRAALSSPLRLALVDLYILFKNLTYTPFVLFPIRIPAPIPGLSSTDLPRKLLNYAIISFISFLQIIILPLAFPLFLWLPGWLFLVYLVGLSAVLAALSKVLHGPLFLKSHPGILSSTYRADLPNERWLFVNGIATSSAGLQITIDRLSALFGRKITGIHNRSQGIPLDILECILQRSLRLATTDVRTVYESLAHELRDPEVNKVVLIAHSQGGIIAALALDRLFVELGGTDIAKLEIYTFGSAASFFNNPMRCEGVLGCGTHGKPKNLGGPAIKIIEHYTNELDLVPRWGVQYGTSSNTSEYHHARAPQPYAGRVFTRQGAGGHLFDEHYMDAMFPVGPDGKLLERGFLDERVDIEMGRENVSSIGKHGERPVQDGDMRWIVDGAEDARGPTVRELSRLHKYVEDELPKEQYKKEAEERAEERAKEQIKTHDEEEING